MSNRITDFSISGTLENDSRKCSKGFICIHRGNEYYKGYSATRQRIRALIKIAKARGVIPGVDFMCSGLWVHYLDIPPAN